MNYAQIIALRTRLIEIKKGRGEKESPEELRKWAERVEDRISKLPERIQSQKTELTAILKDKKKEWGLGEEGTASTTQKTEGLKEGQEKKSEKTHGNPEIAYYGESEKEFSRLFELLKDETELGKLLTALTQFRKQYPHDLSNNSPLPPLEYARENNLIFPYNDFIKICPVTESFRRHILIVKTESGERCLEVKIPGELKFKRNLSDKDFLLGQKAWEMNSENVARPVAMLTTEGKFNLYNQPIEFKGKKPLRIGVFEYEDGKRLARITGEPLTVDRIRLTDDDYIKKVLRGNGLTYKDLAIKTILVALPLLDMGYVGMDRMTQELNLTNFRLLPDGHVEAVSDFNHFLKYNPLLALISFGELKSGERLKKKQIKELLKPFKEVGFNFEAIYKEALDLEAKPFSPS